MKKMLLALSLTLSASFAQYNLITYDSVQTDLGNAVSLSGVEQVVQDSNGVYWFASGNHGYNGLIAFDGQQWFEYSHNSIPPIGSKVNAIAIDKHGELWAAGTEMIHFNGLEWRTYDINRNLVVGNGSVGGVGFIHNWATDIDFNSDGTCFVASEGVGSFTIDDEQFSWIGHVGYKTYRANTDVEVVEDTAYFLNRWIYQNGFRKVIDGKEIDVKKVLYSEDGTDRVLDTLPLYHVLDLKSNPVTKAPVLVRKVDSTKIEILEKADEFWFHRNFYSVKEFDKIELNSDGDVWVLADGYLQSKRETHTAYIVPDQTPGLKGEIENFFLSNDGTLWISTKDDGVTRATPSETSIVSEDSFKEKSLPLQGIKGNNISLNIVDKGYYRIELVSVNGQVVETLFDGDLSTGLQQLNYTQNHASGVYLLRSSGALNFSKRVFLQ